MYDPYFSLPISNIVTYLKTQIMKNLMKEMHEMNEDDLYESKTCPICLEDFPDLVIPESQSAAETAPQREARYRERRNNFYSSAKSITTQLPIRRFGDPYDQYNQNAVSPAAVVYPESSSLLRDPELTASRSKLCRVDSAAALP